MNLIYPYIMKIYKYSILIVCSLLILSACWVREYRQDGYKSESLEKKHRANEKVYEFSVDKSEMSVSFPLSDSLFGYFQEQPKLYRYTGTKPDNWEKEYYSMFISDSKDEDVLNRIIENIRKENVRLSDDQIVERVVAFVQGAIKYDWDSYYDIHRKIKYPYETLYLRRGVCSDKSILLSKLLIMLNYDIVLFQFPKANHLAVGLKVPSGYGQYNTDYCFVETTDYARIGLQPTGYIGGIQLENMPDIISFNKNGTKTFEKIIEYKKQEDEMIEKYGKNYFFASAKEKKLIEDIHQWRNKTDSLKQMMKNAGCEGQVSKDKFEKCKALQKELTNAVEKHNKLVKKHERLVKQRNRR